MPPTAPFHRRPKIPLIAVWIVFCAFCNFLGWILSGLHALNANGYATAFGIGLLAAIVWKVKTGAVFFERRDYQKLRRRFRRLFPAAFLILVALTFVGGLLYAPTNYDALAYREPRVLHWLAESRWHWIHTEFGRMNTRAIGIEWVSAPVIALTNTDRWLFLLNTISILFLPGLTFSVFTRLGVRPRVAWYWMWLLPCSYCFLLQAGGIANDLFGAPFVLAAVDYALRSHQQKSIGSLRLSILAAALFTAAKSTTLPLLLPYTIALAPGWRLWFKGMAGTLCIALVALMVSFAPTALLNVKYAHDWAGGDAKRLPSRASFAEKLSGNTIIILIDGITPPIAPFSGWWNSHVAAGLAQTRIGRAIDANYETDRTIFSMSEMAVEEGSGLGCGIFLLLCCATIAALLFGSRLQLPENRRILALLFFAGTYFAFLVFMTTSYVLATARLLAPYYPLLVVPFLTLTGQSMVVRRKWWRALAMAMFFAAVFPVVTSPARPLFPWKYTLNALKKAGVPEKLVSRAENVYTVYSQRYDAFRPAIQLLPPDERVIGLVTYDEPEAALWRPFGSRRIVHVCHQDTAEDLRSRGIRYVLVHSEKFKWLFQRPFDEWLQQINGTRVATVPLNLRAGDNPVDWWLVKLN